MAKAKGRIGKVIIRKTKTISYSDLTVKIDYYKTYAVNMGFRNIQELISKSLHRYTHMHKDPLENTYKKF